MSPQQQSWNGWQHSYAASSQQPSSHAGLGSYPDTRAHAWPQIEGAWTCGVCTQSNKHTAKVCKCCNVRKGFAQPQLHCGGIAAQTVGPHHASETGPPAQVSVEIHEEHTRTELQQRIKVLEAALAHLPQEGLYEGPRAAIGIEIANAKRRIIELKPVGVRLENCKQAKARAETRLGQAMDAMAQAQNNVESIRKEVIDFTNDINAMEMQIATNANHASHANPTCLQQLQEGMTHVISDMNNGRRLDQTVVASIQGRMQALFVDITNLSHAVNHHAATMEAPLGAAHGMAPASAPLGSAAGAVPGMPMAPIPVVSAVGSYTTPFASSGGHITPPVPLSPLRANAKISPRSRSPYAIPVNGVGGVAA